MKENIVFVRSWNLETIYFNIFRIKNSRDFSLRNGSQFSPFVYWTTTENHFKRGNRNKLFFSEMLWWNLSALLSTSAVRPIDTIQDLTLWYWKIQNMGCKFSRSFSSSRYSSKPGWITQIFKVDTCTYKCDLFA